MDSDVSDNEIHELDDLNDINELNLDDDNQDENDMDEQKQNKNADSEDEIEIEDEKTIEIIKDSTDYDFRKEKKKMMQEKTLHPSFELIITLVKYIAEGGRMIDNLNPDKIPETLNVYSYALHSFLIDTYPFKIMLCEANGIEIVLTVEQKILYAKEVCLIDKKYEYFTTDFIRQNYPIMLKNLHTREVTEKEIDEVKKNKIKWTN